MNCGKISVILTTHNSKYEYLSKCINSILKQTYQEIELIIVDDGSTNGTQKMLSNICSGKNNVKIIYKEASGVSGARNAGIKIATGDYFTFVDHDDWLEPMMFDYMLNALIKYDVDYVACGNYENFNNKQIVDVMYSEDTYLSKDELNALIHKAAYKSANYSYPCFLHSAWGTLVKSKIIKETLYNEKIFVGEDVEWGSRAYKLIECGYYISKPLYHYRGSYGSLSHSARASDFFPAFAQIKKNLRDLPDLKENVDLLIFLLFYQRILISSGTNLRKYYKNNVVLNSCKDVSISSLCFEARLFVFFFTKKWFTLAQLINKYTKYKDRLFFKYITG